MGEQTKGKCERCRKHVGFGNIDYCATCGKDLCPECMEKGCCDDVPALSGLVADDRPMSDEDLARMHERHKRLYPDGA